PIGKTWRRHLIKRGHTIAAMIDVDPNKIGQRIDGTEVISIAQLQPRPGQLHFATVGQREARERIRLEIERHGLSEGQDFFALA
ncbi:MAG: glycosyltransferase family 2 protein, partial [Vicinamibacteria bacterium]|nr:glycosyltransferase family 2 protein [Vicinamibacteria bacterium]